MKIERKEIEIKEIGKKAISETIHQIDLFDKYSKADHECNKKVSLIIRKGLSHDHRYKWYPYWSVKIEGENGSVITWTPTKKLILNFIAEFLIHEARVDRTRSRKSDLNVYKKAINDIILNIQTTLDSFDIPKVYDGQDEN